MCKVDHKANLVRIHTSIMSEPDEEVFWECVICHGAMGRERRSSGSVNCKHDSCKRALKRKREAGEVFEEVEVAEPEKTPRTSCFKIREVVGVDLRVTAGDREKRAGGRLDDARIAFKVRGGFGEDKDDELIPDTRWIKLPVLVNNIAQGPGHLGRSTQAGDKGRAAAPT